MHMMFILDNRHAKKFRSNYASEIKLLYIILIFIMPSQFQLTHNVVAKRSHINKAIKLSSAK